MHTPNPMPSASLSMLAGAFALLFCASCATAQSPVTPADAPAAPSPQAPRAYTGMNVSGRASGRVGGPVIAEYPTISSVVPGSPAANAGLVSGDVILEVEGQDAREEGVRINRLGKYTLRIRRGNTVREVTVVGIPYSAAPPRR